MSGGLIRISSPSHLRVSTNEGGAGAAAYYEAEAQAARDRAQALGAYYEHAVPARLLHARADGEVATTPLMSGDVAVLFREGRLPDGRQIVPPRALTLAHRRVGADLPITASKEISALRTAADLAGEFDLVREIDAAFSRVTEEVVRVIACEGMVRARAGHADSLTRPAAEIAIIEVTHDLSRAGDPALHKHFVVVNGSIRGDGRPATIDLTGVVENRFRLSAMLSAGMAREMRALGFRIDEVGREGSGSLELRGLPENLLTTWSKRRTAIVAESGRPAAGGGHINDEARATQASTKTRREMRQYVTLNTRDVKDRLPSRAALEAKHRAEVTHAGTSPDQLLAAAKAAGATAHICERDVVALSRARLLDESSTATLIQIRRTIAQASAVLGWNAEQMAAAEATLLEEMVVLGRDNNGRAVYATKEMIALERSFRQTVDAALGRGSLRPEDVEWAIEQLAKDPDQPILLADEQRSALRHCARGDAVVAVRGVAGAGKTVAMRALTMAASRRGMRVISSAPTNRAATGLAEEAGTHARKAIQGLRMAIEAGRGETLDVDAATLLIVDEAGMVEMRDAAVVLKYFRDRGAQVVFIGDERQLSPIGAGAPFRLLKHGIGAAELKQIRRQAVGWQREASLKAASGDSVALLHDYDAHGRLILADGRAGAFASILQSYAEDLASNPTGTRLLIAQRHADVHALNERARTAEIAAGRLGDQEIIISTLHRGGVKGAGVPQDLRLRVGDALIFWAGLRDLGIDNGDRARLMDIAMPAEAKGEATLKIRLESSGRILEVRPSDLIPPARADQHDQHHSLPLLQHGYCSTIYSAQGTTVDRSWVYGGAGMDRETAYVALTRHRLDSQVVYDGDAIAERMAERAERCSRERIRQAAFEAAAVTRIKTCIGDFVEDHAYWLRTGEIRPMLPDLDRVARIMKVAAGPRPASAQARLRIAARAELRRQRAKPESERPISRETSVREERRAARAAHRADELVASYNRRVYQRETAELQDRALTHLSLSLQARAERSLAPGTPHAGAALESLPLDMARWVSRRMVAAENAARAAIRADLLAGTMAPLIVAIRSKYVAQTVANLDALRPAKQEENAHVKSDADRYQGRHGINSVAPLASEGAVTDRSAEPAPRGSGYVAGIHPAPSAGLDGLRGAEFGTVEDLLARRGEGGQGTGRTGANGIIDPRSIAHIGTLLDLSMMERGLIVPRIAAPIALQMLPSASQLHLPPRASQGDVERVPAPEGLRPFLPGAAASRPSIGPLVTAADRALAQELLAATALERHLIVPVLPGMAAFSMPVSGADKQAADECAALALLERHLVVPVMPMPLRSYQSRSAIDQRTAAKDGNLVTQKKLSTAQPSLVRKTIAKVNAFNAPAPSSAPDVAPVEVASKADQAAAAIIERAARRAVAKAPTGRASRSLTSRAVREAAATAPRKQPTQPSISDLIDAFRSAQKARNDAAFLAAALQIVARAETAEVREALSRGLIKSSELARARGRAAAHAEAQESVKPALSRISHTKLRPKGRGGSR